MGFLPPLTYKATNTSESVDIQVPLFPVTNQVILLPHMGLIPRLGISI